MRVAAQAWRALAVMALLGLVALGGLMLVPPLAGYERYVIEGGSMGSTIPRGSIAYERAVPVARVRVGDVITYRPPARVTRLVTHRVVWIGRGPRGERLYRTRGDANSAPDPWRFTLPGRTQARVAFHVPVAGYVLEGLALRWLRLAVIGVPALAIAVAAFAGMWRRPEARGERA